MRSYSSSTCTVKTSNWVKGLLFKIVIISLGFYFIFPYVSDAKNRHPSLKSIDVTRQEAGVIITIHTDAKIKSFIKFTLNAPPRIVFDLYNVKSPYKGIQSLPVNTPWVKQVRHYDRPKKLRIVLDLNVNPYRDYTINQLYDIDKMTYWLEIQ